MIVKMSAHHTRRAYAGIEVHRHPQDLAAVIVAMSQQHEDEHAAITDPKDDSRCSAARAHHFL
jgi:hypothetical protein